MSDKSDKLATRLIGIIIELSMGRKLDVKELSIKYGVSQKTITTDLNKRLKQFLPITKENGVYFLETPLADKLNSDDIREFAKVSGIDGLYPSLTDEFIADTLNPKINDSLHIKQGKYEDISSKSNEFRILQLAITLKHKVGFIYNDKQRMVNPYKLANINDIWYLVADEEDEIKTFAFTKIKKLLKTNEAFNPNREYIELINKNEQDWFSKKTTRVILKIDKEISHYFKRRNLFANQTILKETSSYIILQTFITYEDELLGMIKYWLPYIEIEEPHHLQEKLKNQLKSYMDRYFL